MDTLASLKISLPVINDNLETFSLVWLDSTVEEGSNRGACQKLRAFLYHLKTFVDASAGQRYIEQKSTDDRLVLIVSGRFGREVVPKVHQLRQVSSIYVFCMDKKANEQWASEYAKINLVTVECNELISTIEADLKIQMKIDEPFFIQIFYPDAGNDMKKKKTNEEFLYFQLFLNYLQKIKSTQQDQDDFIDLLRENYKGGNNQLELIDQFQQEYSSNNVLAWYTSQSFFHHILSKALNMQNIPVIIHFRAFISDLCSQSKERQPTSPLKVYRSQILSMDEINYLKENLGQLMSINSFWYADTVLSKAVADAEKFNATADLQRVLFMIDADLSSTTDKVIVLPKTEDENDDSSEVLFMAASVFHLTEIKQQDDRPWLIKLTLCTDKEYNAIFESLTIKIPYESDEGNLLIFAKILSKMDHPVLAKIYYNRLINELPSNDPLLKIMYKDFAKTALEKKDYETAVEWYRKAALTKSDYCTETSLDGVLNTGTKTSRPACPKWDKCDQLNDDAHTHVYFHRLACRYGSLCRMVDEESHSQTYTHPEFCGERGLCTDMNGSHLLKYRHVPLCPKGLTCPLLHKHDSAHCDLMRHCKPNCEFGSFCFNIHNVEHMENENHPFKAPCPFTPYMCHLDDHLSEDNEEHTTENISYCRAHRMRYSHICPRGRNCPKISDKEHTTHHIHVMRLECPNQDSCKLLNDEDHLNSYSHSSINDIRTICLQQRAECPNRLDAEHIRKFRHTGPLNHLGVSRSLGLNKGINFFRNQNEMLDNIRKYIQASNWTSTTLTIPDEIKRWIRALRPVHRCSKVIFESILVHGHAMSKDHMNNLKEAIAVAKAIKHHAEVKRILAVIKNARVQHAGDEYIRILVEKEFAAANSGEKSTASEASASSRLKEFELILKDYITREDMDEIKEQTHKISEASLRLNANQTGIGFDADVALGTNKHVFSILGPHAGYYYGDIVLVFSRELMLHPDSNFSIHAATTFGKSQNAYRWRPWLTDPGSPETRIEHFHRNKLHCSVEGYEEAAAAELLVGMGLKSKSITDIGLDAIKQRWSTVDSHLVFEAHLPQLIPLDYIERVYIAQSTFDSLSKFAQELSKKIFGPALCIAPYQIDDSIPPAGLHKPLDSTRVPYQAFLLNEMFQMIETELNSTTLKEGTWITIPSSRFLEQIVNPMTISQSFEKSQSTSNSIYIYWEVLGGDMMLTLTNQLIDVTTMDQPGLQCLTCYIHKWSSNNILKTTTHAIYEYREGSTYISDNHPRRHYFIMDDHKFKASSDSFHRGCNVDDFIMYCLHIDRAAKTVTLSICRSNSIYNHQKITCVFDSTELDLNTLEFIQISAGMQTVAVRNLIIRHEPVKQFHPTIDIDYIKTQTSLDVVIEQTNAKPKLKNPSNLCADSIHCLLQYSETKEGKEHNDQYTHPCRFSEKCRQKHREPHLVHIPHTVPNCDQDTKCSQLGNPLHRAQYRHSNLPDYLVPCKFQQGCKTKSAEHRIKYSHGEKIPLPSFEDVTN